MHTICYHIAGPSNGQLLREIVIKFATAINKKLVFPQRGSVLIDQITANNSRESIKRMPSEYELY